MCFVQVSVDGTFTSVIYLVYIEYGNVTSGSLLIKISLVGHP